MQRCLPLIPKPRQRIQPQSPVFEGQSHWQQRQSLVIGQKLRPVPRRLRLNPLRSLGIHKHSESV